MLRIREMIFKGLLARILMVAFICFFTSTQVKSQDEASSGFWNNSSTWSSGTTPGNGDVLIIPAGVTVNVNCNCGLYSGMTIEVYGTLNFPGGRKINLSNDGIVNVYSGGEVTGSNNGDKIIIGGSTVWTGKNPDIEGPTTCDVGGCAENTTLPIELKSFSTSVNEHSIEVDWVSATEKNNDYYLLSYSYDFEYWQELIIINGAGNSNIDQSYSYTFPADELTENAYIRLSQFDYDGSNEILAEEYVKISSSEQPLIYPNPVKDILWLDQLDDVAFFKIIDLAGNTTLFEKSSSLMTVEFESKFQPGVYFVLFYNSSYDLIDQEKIFFSDK